MMDSECVELLFEPIEMLLAIRSCEEDNPYAIKWGKNKDGKMLPLIKASIGFSSILYKRLNWDPKDRYRLIGVRRTKGKDSVVLFDLNTAEKIHREEIINDSSDELTIKTITYLDEYLIDHFGNDYYQDVYSMRLYLMDLLKKWNLDAELIPVTKPDEWLVKAKELVNKHLAKLMEG